MIAPRNDDEFGRSGGWRSWGGGAAEIPRFSVGFDQVPQQQAKWHQGEREEKRAAVMVHGRVDHFGADVDTEFADGEDAEAISGEGKRNHCDGIARRMGERRKKYPASRLVIKRAIEEWMPLHSGAT